MNVNQVENASSVTVLGIGNPFLDRIGFVESLPNGLEKGNTHLVFEKTAIEQSWTAAPRTKLDAPWSIGGSCQNVIKVLTHLLPCFNVHSTCSLLGMAGKDKKEELHQRLTRIGIHSLLIEGKDDNGIVNSFVTPDRERTLQTFCGASFELSSRHIMPEYFKNVSHVHLEGYLAYFEEVLETSIQRAQENNATISLDLSSVAVINDYREKFTNCIKKVDIISGNLQEMQAFTNHLDVPEILNSFAHTQMVVITNGAQKGYIKLPKEAQVITFEVPQIENPLDTTGAGDFFSGGLLAGILAKKDIQTSILIAKLAAFFVLQQQGADLPESEWKNLKTQVSKLN